MTTSSGAAAASRRATGGCASSTAPRSDAVGARRRACGRQQPRQRRREAGQRRRSSRACAGAARRRRRGRRRRRSPERTDRTARRRPRGRRRAARGRRRRATSTASSATSRLLPIPASPVTNDHQRVPGAGQRPALTQHRPLGRPADEVGRVGEQLERRRHRRRDVGCDGSPAPWRRASSRRCAAPELAQQRGHVRLDGPFGDVQAGGDLGVGQVLTEQRAAPRPRGATHP